jgi:negative modulator of initiation of replication
MHTIEIDHEVFNELARRATGFNIQPNDVLRALLQLGSHPVTPQLPRMSNGAAPATAIPATLPEFVRSDRFRRYHQAVDKFLAMLGWLHHAHPKRFPDVIGSFQRGTRRYFAKSEREILQSGDGVTAKPIPQSPFWALTTLDNKSKRIIIEDVLRALGHSSNDIDLALAQLPDSGIRRKHGRGHSFQRL